MSDRRRGSSGWRAVALLLVAGGPACAGSGPQVPTSRTAIIDTRHGRAALVLDFDRMEGERTEIDRLLASHDAEVALISAPGAGIWKRLRDLAPPRVQITLVEACADGRTAACTREAGRFIEQLRDGPAWAPTGAIVEDEIAGSAAAPPTIVVPTGQFQINVIGPGGSWMERQAGRPVRLLRQIAVARTETTVAQFRRFVEASGYRPGKGCWHHTREQVWESHEDADWTKPVFSQGPDHPVTCITFEDATAYAAWLTAKTGHTWRLPTEAEFEFFNRSGHVGRFGVDAPSVTDLCAKTNGADQTSGLAYANACDDGFAATAPAGSYPANAFGLFDTTGNVWELTTDCVGREFVRVLKDRLRLAPSNASASGSTDCRGRHVVRGGAFLSSPGNLEPSYYRLEGYRANRTGFRVVRELP
ncbi:MAG TPA: SUMF1/EgtB/PvdO family nonheme iron enzyme [Vicinamibacterales bacterium]|jgi:formylglycine-generating enzyme required for sulfatase activity|nr:SUMF1/EgtB/PvdO family nonheme iron enzyme [Vicinamibacterales bacterium]